MPYVARPQSAFRALSILPVLEFLMASLRGNAIRLLSLISVAGVLSLQLAGGSPPPSIKIFWIPPQVQTYIAVTADNIEAQAFKIVEVRDSEQSGEILALIKKSKQTIDAKMIRIKISGEISGESKSYIFDSKGIGVSPSGEPVEIDLNKLKMALSK